VGPVAALSLLCRLMADVAHSYGKVLNQKIIKLRLENLAAKAVQYRPGGGSLFADTPFTLEELGKVSRKKIAVLMDFVHVTSAYEVYIL